MVIYPEVITTPDNPTIKFHQPRDKVDLEKELPRILAAQGWNCGTYFNVQFMNHEKTKLLACARFVVSEESESVQTNDANPYQPMTKTVYTRHAEQVGEWWPKTQPAVFDYKNGLADRDSISDIRETDPPIMAVAEEPKRRGRTPKAA